MAVRYRNIITNNADLWYRLDILDANYFGSVTSFQSIDFSFDFKGQNNNRWDSTWGSQVSVEALSTPDLDLTGLIDDIIGAAEGRFNIAVYKSTDGTSYDFEWIGIILNDLSGGTDEAPNQRFILTAVDGLGALKGIDFNQNATTPLPSATAGFTLIYALKKLPYNSFFGNSDDFLKSAVQYYEAEMVSTSGSPLNWTSIPNTTFYSVDKNGEYKWDSCYDVIDKICQLFGCRIFFGGGSWRLIDVRAWETSTSVDVYTWSYAGAVGGTTTSMPLRYAIDGSKLGTRIATQSFDNFAPLRKLTRKYLHDTARNLVQGITVNTSNGLQTVQDSIPETGSENLAVSGSIQFTVTETAATGVAQQVFVKLRFSVKYGSYYLKREVTNQTQNSDYSFMTWENSTEYVEYIGVFNVQYLGGMTMAVSFETPALPNLGSADLDVNLEKVYIQDLQQNDLSGSYTYAATFGSIYIEYVDGNDVENERTYFVDNDTTAFYSDIGELRELNVGDKINPMTQNRLIVFDGTTNVDSTGNWGRNTVVGTTELIPLVLENIIAGQRTAVKKRSGQFVGAFDPWKVLEIDGEYYLPLGVRFSVKNGSFDGEWYLAGTYDDSDLDGDFISTPVGDVVPILPPSILPPSGGGTPVTPPNVNLNNGQLLVTALPGDEPIIVNDTGGTPVFTVGTGGAVTALNFNGAYFGWNDTYEYLYGGAGELVATGLDCSFFGRYSGTSNSGNKCVGFGESTLTFNTNDNNTAVGFQALRFNSGTNAVGIGVDALRSNSGSTVVGVGGNSLYNNTSSNAVGIGHGALYNNTGSNSCGLGYQALYDNTGNFSNGFGLNALYSNTGLRSNGVGNSCLQNNEGNDCNGFGLRTLQNNEGNNNNAFGSDALRYTASTSANLTALGHNAAIGTSGTPVDFDNSTALGANSTINADNQVNFGDSNVDNFRFGENMEVDIDSTWYTFGDGTNAFLKLGLINKRIEILGGLTFAVALPAADAADGTLYEDDTDGKLYYKDLSGTSHALT